MFHTSAKHCGVDAGPKGVAGTEAPRGTGNLHGRRHGEAWEGGDHPPPEVNYMAVLENGEIKHEVHLRS